MRHKSKVAPIPNYDGSGSNQHVNGLNELMSSPISLANIVRNGEEVLYRRDLCMR